MTLNEAAAIPRRRFLRKVVEVRPLETDQHGTYEPVVMDCGHTEKLNPTMLHRVGDVRRCFICENPR